MATTWLLELTSVGLCEVDVDALKLEVRLSLVHASGVNAMLISNDLPEGEVREAESERSGHPTMI